MGSLPGSPARLDSESGDGWRDLTPAIPVRVRLREEPDGRKLDYHPLEDLHKPDLLLYWSSSPIEGPDELPEGAKLLGSLSGAQARVFELGDELEGDGRLVVYSLAHGTVVGSAALASGGE